jgi:RNA polymerase sigma factor (sigma-70 family)
MPTREERILSLTPNVYAIAGKLRRKLPRHMDLGDLRSAGWIGAIEATDRFELGHGASLATFADRRIRGAILDYLRSLDPLSTCHRKRLKADPNAIAPVTVSLSLAIRHDGGKSTLESFLADTRPQIEVKALHARLTVERLFTLAKLKPRSEQIVRRAAAGERHRTLAAEFHVHESRISQICDGAYRDLRAR